MDETKLALYWSEIPADSDFTLSYSDLCKMWNCDERRARQILHELSTYDDGTNYILIRSSNGSGFFKTDDLEIIRAYKKEIMNRGKNIFKQLTKINKMLSANADQYNLENNMKLIRERKGLTQSEVCDAMKNFDKSFDKSLLSKMENGVCLPTPWQTIKLAEIYCVDESEILRREWI